jgi:imidazole glycerol-phosphate synthase subunit HisH
MIAIVDYGMGNLGSILNMLKRIGAPATITSDPDTIASAEKLILPGVGAFDRAMERLNALELVPVLNRMVVERRTPILGICLGMQLLTKGSEEGDLPGLGWIDAQTLRFEFAPEAALRVPHMGWNGIAMRQPTAILEDMYADPRFYFVHSFYVRCRNETDVIATARYGSDFDAVIGRDNIVGTQFHPEKSHKFGLKLLGNFAKMPV